MESINKNNKNVSVKSAAEKKLQSLLSSVSHSYHSINCPPSDQHSRLHYSTLTFDPAIVSNMASHARLSVVSSNSSLSNISTNYRLSRSCDHLVKEQVAPKVRLSSPDCIKLLVTALMHSSPNAGKRKRDEESS